MADAAKLPPCVGCGSEVRVITDATDWSSGSVTPAVSGALAPSRKIPRCQPVNVLPRLAWWPPANRER